MGGWMDEQLMVEHTWLTEMNTRSSFRLRCALCILTVTSFAVHHWFIGSSYYDRELSFDTDLCFTPGLRFTAVFFTRSNKVE